MSAHRDAENTRSLSPAELEKVRAFGLDREPRIFDDTEGIRFGFLIVGGMSVIAIAVGALAVALVTCALGRP